MRWALRIFLVLLALVIFVPVLLVALIWIGLNTNAGRAVAVTQINHFGAGQISVAGLAGHFPADLKLSHVAVSDADGVWLTGDDLELRWRPQRLFARVVDVTALTAETISVTRAPVAGKANAQTGASSPPNFKIDVDRLAVRALNIGAALAGRATTLAITGGTHLQNETQGDFTLNAVALNGAGTYRLVAAIDPKKINATLHVSEPPDGLLGHYAGPRVHAPLMLDLALAGPRDQAALHLAATLGAARLDGAGTLGLNPAAPDADVTFTIPALGPYAAIAGQNIAGSTRLHIIAAQQRNATDLSLDGVVALTAAPGPAARLVGPNGQIALRVSLADNIAHIATLAISGAGVDIRASGDVAQAGVDLTTHLALGNMAAIAPGMAGNIAEDGTIIGTAKDFAVNARLTGAITEKNIPTGPFSITIDAQHLPQTPNGTLTGSGALEGFPLLLDAAFSRDADGTANLLIKAAHWRSLDADARLSLAAGGALPTGTAAFSVRRLADFADFAPVKLAGSINGKFAHLDATDFSLNLAAQNLLVAPAIGPIDAKVDAAGPADALAVKLTAATAKLLDAPARVAAAGVLNLNARALALSSLAASWKTIDAKLLGPAGVETKPAVTVQHLALALNGGRIDLDGTLSPKLNLHLAAQNLPANLAALAAPTVKASGTLDMTAAVTGTPAAPAGRVTLAAHDIKLHTGAAAALPAADFTADIQLAKTTADVTAKLGLGPNVDMNAVGLVPLSQTGPLSLHLTGTTDLRLLDPILAQSGTTLRGVITPDLTVTGTPAAPRADGIVTLADGSVQNIGSGLNLTAITADIAAAGRLVTLETLKAKAGAGGITARGTIDLGMPKIPIDLAINATNATPVASDLVTETVNAALTLKGFLQGAMAFGGDIDILKATINIPKSLPPSVARLTILNRGAPPPPPAPPPPDVALNLTVRADNQIFIRGDGLFAELSGTLRLTGTAADPDPEGGFTLVRGNFALAGKTLQFTSGTVSFTGDGFVPSLDLEATTTTAANTTASLIVGGTAAKPTITLSASPPLPSDEVLSQLLFGEATTSLSPFQAASLAAALASLSGIGGSAVSDPLGGVRNALGLDELSLGGSSTGAPTVNAGRYVAPGVYVGAQQSTSGQGTQATVQINLYKGLQLQTATGTGGSGSGTSSSVGLTYQFDY